MILRVAALISLASMLFSCGGSASGDRLSNAAAKDAIERFFNAESWIIRLGPMVVLSQMTAQFEGEDYYGKGRLSPTRYQELLAWAKLGIISISVDQQFEAYKAGKSFSWDQYMQQSVGGTGSKIVVSTTPLGDGLMAKLPKDVTANVTARFGTGWLIIPQGKFKVTRIVENVGYRGSGVDLRMVSFLYDATWEPIYKEWHSLMKSPVSEQRKARMLLKYDPFKSTWQPYVWDSANTDAEFDSKAVPIMLREIETSRPSQ
jgi:hypothetical protein